MALQRTLGRLRPAFAKDIGWIDAIVAGSFVAYVLFVLVSQSGVILDPAYAHEEQRLLFRYHGLADPALFRGDYVTSFVTAFAQPYLYDFATRMWLWAGGELLTWHRVLALACWLTFLAGIALAARRLGDRWTMLGAAGLVAAQPIYLYQITSAIPHAFAFPLLIWAVVALLSNSVIGLVVVALASGLLYPAIAPLTGLLLAWHVFVTRRALLGPGADRLKALLVVGATGLLSAWMLYGALHGPESFGGALAPGDRIDLYPENGPEGRHFYGIFHPLKYVMAKSIMQFRWSDNIIAVLVMLAYSAIAIRGFLSLPRGRPGRRAMLGFIVCGAALYVAVYGLRPAHLYRFVLYPAFTVLPLLFAVGIFHVCRNSARHVRMPNAGAIVAFGVLALSFDSRNPEKIGYWYHFGSDFRQVAAFASGRPPQTMFAAWLGTRNELEFLPYVARRPLFVMRKAHYPTYEKHILAMRERTYALIDAYFATDGRPLRRLHCRWGVDYLVVEKAHFSGREEDRPSYFAPFDARIEEKRRIGEKAGFVLRAPDARWVALETPTYTVLKLGAVGGGTCP